MAQRPLPQSSTKLLAIQKDFQQIATMAGFLNSGLDLPQLRLSFTLYGRVLVPSAEEGLRLTPRLQAWSERIALRLREDSSSAVLPPQIQVASPQPLPNGEGYYLVTTLTFASKVTEQGYQRVRSAVLSAYQAAVALRERGNWGEPAPADEAPAEEAPDLAAPEPAEVEGALTTVSPAAQPEADPGTDPGIGPGEGPGSPGPGDSGPA